MIQSGLSIRQLTKYILKLKVKPGSLLLFQDGIIHPEDLQKMATILPQNGIKDVLLLVVRDIHGIANLDEKEMNKYGWFKINQLMEQLKMATPQPAESTSEQDSEKPND